MAQNSFSSLFSDEQIIEWLRHHMLVMHGYALALAQKAGLNAAAAAQLFVEPLLSFASSWPSLTPQLLEQQAIQNATVLAITYGEQHVQVERDGDAWLVQVRLTDTESLERYGASLEFHTQWIATQLRLVCEPKGINCNVWLTGNMLHIQLSSVL